MTKVEQTTIEPNYVAFRTAEQEYCVDIMSVREIREWVPVSALPQVPPYILGVINLRGSVVPILNFSIRMGLQAPIPTDKNVVIIVQIRNQTVGLLVDEVSEILHIRRESVKRTPDVGFQSGELLVAGIIEVEKRLIRLVNLELLFPIVDQEAA